MHGLQISTLKIKDKTGSMVHAFQADAMSSSEY